jgi:site-specific DNA-methyltransferase (adenine-specific)
LVRRRDGRARATRCRPERRRAGATCGDGAILRQIPLEIAAFGVELDAGLAQQARETSGREVIVGDVLELDLPYPVTRVIGNPPYRVSWLNRFLTRYHRVLPEGGEITLLLPAFALQTSRRTSLYAQQYGIEARFVPRDIFPGFNLPLSLVTFRKERERRLIGLAFYQMRRKAPSFRVGI